MGPLLWLKGTAGTLHCVFTSGLDHAWMYVPPYHLLILTPSSSSFHPSTPPVPCCRCLALFLLFNPSALPVSLSPSLPLSPSLSPSLPLLSPSLPLSLSLSFSSYPVCADESYWDLVVIVEVGAEEPAHSAHVSL